MAGPLVQIALDFTDPQQAIAAGKDALEAGADWLEAGYPLVSTCGVGAIGQLHRAFPARYILVDFMVIVGARRFVEAAKSQGAQNLTVSALAPDFTVQECICEGQANGIEITVDLFHVADVAGAAKKYAAMGADYVCVHLGADEKRANPARSALRDLERVLNAVELPVSFASYTLQEAVSAARLGAAVVAQGEPMISAADRRGELARFVEAVKTAR